MRHARMGLLLLAGTLVLTQGCASLGNLVVEPAVYGGVRYDLRYLRSDPESMVFCMFDLPFSAVLDTALLPLTGLMELIRRLSGWPPPPPY
jgi:uncharacterized protein YceK